MKHTQLIQIISASLLFLLAHTAFRKLIDHTKFYLTQTSILHHKTASLLLSWSQHLWFNIICIIITIIGIRLSKRTSTTPGYG